jgi:hypothetical protein
MSHERELYEQQLKFQKVLVNGTAKPSKESGVDKITEAIYYAVRWEMCE